MNGRRGTPWRVLALLACAGVGEARAQAICSAPHSSPVLARSGSLGTLPPGAGWVQLSLLGQRTDEAFDPRGDRRAFLGGTEFETGSIYLTGAVGVAPGVEVWAQVPVHRLEVRDPSGTRSSSGAGDVRGAVRIGPALVGLDAPVALRLGVKVPGSDFPVDPTVLPLTEGQVDVELSAETGWAADGARVYVVGWVGHRWRREFVDALYRPGDEVFAHLAVGGVTRAVRWELGADGLWGADPVEQGVTLSSADRGLVQLLPTVGVAVGPVEVDVTAPFAVSGRNLPVARALGVAIRLPWGP